MICLQLFLVYPRYVNNEFMTSCLLSFRKIWLIVFQIICIWPIKANYSWWSSDAWLLRRVSSPSRPVHVPHVASTQWGGQETRQLTQTTVRRESLSKTSGKEHLMHNSSLTLRKISIWLSKNWHLKKKKNSKIFYFF